MGSINIVKNIKRIHPNCIIMVKMGNFYHVYSKDAYILSYLFKYKIKENEEIPECGFPLVSLSKVEATLEKNKINYMVIDKRSNYEVEGKNISKQENNYEKIYEKSKITVSYMIRIQKIGGNNEKNKYNKDWKKYSTY